MELANKFNIKIKSNLDSEEELREKDKPRDMERDKFSYSKGLTIDIVQTPMCSEEKGNLNQINNNFNNSETDKNIKQNLIIVESAFPDLNDFKLDQALINIFNKKKMSFISVKRLNDDNYEFGTLKVQIKFDGDIIRGKF